MRVLIAPHDIAGQMGILARSLRSEGVDAWSVDFGGKSGYLKFEVDEVVNLGRGNKVERMARAGWSAQKLVRRFDVLHYFFALGMLPRLADVKAARRLKKPIFVHFRGSDVTSIRQRVYGSGAMHPTGAPLPHRGSERQIRVVRQWRSLADKLLISTPDLWREVPDAIWIPQAIEVEHWPYMPKFPSRGETIVVGHAPTNAVVKGTAHIENAIASLRRQGLDIRLELIMGVPPSEVRSRMERCHLAVDQILPGSYGNVTLQFMALGRPTLNYLDPLFSERGIQVPTAVTTPSTLAEDITRLLSDPDEFKSLAVLGRGYVESVHAGSVIAQRLRGLYEAAGGSDH